MESVITAHRVHKTYESGSGVDGVSLQIPRGHIVGMIGPSGSGKTTTVRLLAGLLGRDGGELAVLGADPEHFDRALRARLGYLPQSTALYPTLSMRENLEFIGSLYRMVSDDRRRAAVDMLEMVDLSGAADRPLSEASGGMTRRLGLAAALMHDPDIAFLDEPTAGLDPILRRSLWDRFRDLRDSGKTLIITTQYVGEAADCDSILLLTDGSVVESGEPEEVRRSAFGGELVDVVFAETPTWATLEHLRKAVDASEVRTTGPRSVRLTVPDAGSAIPLVTAVVADTDVEITEAERYLPDFDEVFVRIVGRHAGGSA